MSRRQLGDCFRGIRADKRRRLGGSLIRNAETRGARINREGKARATGPVANIRTTHQSAPQRVRLGGTRVECAQTRGKRGADWSGQEGR
jgi:hypothetical protein